MSDTFDIESYADLKTSNWLTWEHVGEGNTMTLTVAKFFGVREGDRKRGVLVFEEKNNDGQHWQYTTQKTNEELLKAIFGPSPKALIGKKITLCVGWDKFKGKDVRCLRVYGSPEVAEQFSHTVNYSKRSGRAAKTFMLHPVAEVSGDGQAQKIQAHITSAKTIEELDALVPVFQGIKKDKSLPPDDYHRLRKAYAEKRESLKGPTVVQVSDGYDDLPEEEAAE